MIAAMLVLTIPLLLSLFAYGVRRWLPEGKWPRVRQAGDAAHTVVGWWWRLLLRRHGLLAWLAAFIAANVVVCSVEYPWFTVLVWAVAYAIAVARHRPPEPPQWWDEANLSGAFRDAGLLARGKPDNRPMLRRYGQPVHDEDGTTVTIGAPAGQTLSSIRAKRESLAAELRMPLDRLIISQTPGDPANRVRLKFTTPVDLTPRTPAVAAEAVTAWATPILIGRDNRGRDVTTPTHDIGQYLIGGRTGQGKTTLMRLIVAHFILDPTCRIFGADGKGDKCDWGGLGARAEQWVFLTPSPDTGARLIAMLETVEGIITERGNSGKREHPGVLLVLDDTAALLKKLDPKTRKRAVELITSIVLTGRSARVVTVIATQRPSAEAFSTEIRSQSAVSIALAMKTPDDARMVLGHVPTLPLPEKRGDAILSDDHGDRTVHIDHLTDTQWSALCGRAPAPPVAPQDAPHATHTPEQAPAGTEPPPKRSGPWQVPLLLAVCGRIVGEHPERQMTTTALFAALNPDELTDLPADQYPTDPRDLGRRLTEHGWPSVLVRVDGVKVRVRRHADLITMLRTTDRYRRVNVP